MMPNLAAFPDLATIGLGTCAATAGMAALATHRDGRRPDYACDARLGCQARLQPVRDAIFPVTPVFKIRTSVGDRTPTANPRAAAACARAAHCQGAP